MKICSSFNNYNNSSQSFSGINPEVVKKAIKKVAFKERNLPNFVGDVGCFASTYFSSAEQKLLTGLTALFLVPRSDLKHAEEDKKVDAAIKSTAKIAVGTTTGVLIRSAFISLFNKKINLNDKLVDTKELLKKSEKVSFFNTYLRPTQIEKMIDDNRTNKAIIEKAKRELKQYNNTLGTLVAIAIMVLFTNKAIDVPLTSDLMDIISGVVKENKSVPDSIAQVTKTRIDKISNWGKDKITKVMTFKNKMKDAFSFVTQKNENGDKQ